MNYVISNCGKAKRHSSPKIHVICVDAAVDHVDVNLATIAYGIEGVVEWEVGLVDAVEAPGTHRS